MAPMTEQLSAHPKEKKGITRGEFMIGFVGFLLGLGGKPREAEAHTGPLDAASMKSLEDLHASGCIEKFEFTPKDEKGHYSLILTVPPNTRIKKYPVDEGDNGVRYEFIRKLPIDVTTASLAMTHGIGSEREGKIKAELIVSQSKEENVFVRYFFIPQEDGGMDIEIQAEGQGVNIVKPKPQPQPKETPNSLGGDGITMKEEWNHFFNTGPDVRT
jgi:hypothetical protein